MAGRISVKNLICEGIRNELLDHFLLPFRELEYVAAARTGPSQHHRI